MVFHRDQDPREEPLADIHNQMGAGAAYLLMAGGCLFGLWFAVDGFEDILAKGPRITSVSTLVIGVVGATWLAERVARFPKDGPRFVQEHAGRRERPNEPWLWRDEWAANRIEDHTANEALRAAAAAVMWNVASVVLLSHAPPAPQRTATLVWFFRVLFIVGITAMACTVYFFLRWRKFGTTSLVLDAVPARMGGSVTGTIHVPRLAGGELSIRMKLTNLHVRYKPRRTTTLTDAVQVTTRFVPQGETLAIPVSVPIPTGGMATHAGEHEEVQWRLRVSVACPGFDYKARFDVPVFG